MKTKSELKRIAVQNPDALLKELERLRELTEDALDGTEAHIAQLEMAAAENEKLKQNLISRNEVREILENELIKVRAENEKLRETLKQVKQLREADEDEIKKLENELGKVRAENEKLWDGTVLGRLKAENEKLNGQVETLRAQLAETEELLMQARDSLCEDGALHEREALQEIRAYLNKKKARGEK